MTQAEQVKCAQVDMLVEVKRICEKHGLSYFLAYGTLLGAIRHNGFIPWDDDIDLVMPRQDYESFIEKCKMELSPFYELIDWHMDPKSPLPFLKLKIKGSHYRETLSQNTDMNDGIYIDIFPLDNAPDNVILRKIRWFQCYLIKKILLLRCGFSIATRKKMAKRLAYFLLMTVSKYRTIESWKKAFESAVAVCNRVQTKDWVCYSGGYDYKKEILPKYYFESAYHLFETEEFRIPRYYEDYLINYYGDYMELPPEEKRQGRHGVVLVELGDYRIRTQRLVSMQLDD